MTLGRGFLRRAWPRRSIGLLGGIQVDPQGRRPMEHKPLSDLSNVADLVPEMPKASLTRRERLERWIQVLDREPGRALNTLHQIDRTFIRRGYEVAYSIRSSARIRSDN